MKLFSSARIAAAAIAIAALPLWGGVSAAFDDGFGSSRKLDGKNISLYLMPGVEPLRLVWQLGIGVSDEALAKREVREKLTPEVHLSNVLDGMFNYVCDLLDMPLRLFRINMKVCRDYNQLAGIWREIAGQDLSGRNAFYHYDTNTIYVSGDDFRREVVGLEMSYAVIDHYFPVPPPKKIKDLLAVYVEYGLRQPSLGSGR